MEEIMLEGRKALLSIKPYVPGKPIEEVERELGITNVVKMASNENPLGPSPDAVLAIRDAAEKAYLYPDGSCHYLRQELGEYLGVGPNQLIVGNGSDEILKLLAEAYVNDGDETIMAQPSFSEYDFATQLMGGTTVMVPTRDFTHDLQAMADAITERTRIIFICNPNNPTGTIVTRQEMDAFMERVPARVLVVFDEAYFEYVEHPEYASGLAYVLAGRPNVIVLRTFSKVYGLAGLRVGYGVAVPQLIEWISRTREPFNVNLIAQAAARASLKDPLQVTKSREVNHKGKLYLYQRFQQMGLKYVPTQANFILVDTGHPSRQVFQAMLKAGVIVRTGDIFGLDTFIRVTIGTERQNQRMADTLAGVLAVLNERQA